MWERDNKLLNFNTEKVKQIQDWKKAKKPWTACPFKGKTTSAESHYLYELVRRLGPGNYADLGVLYGKSTVTMAYGLLEAKNEGTIFAVDYFGTDAEYPDQIRYLLPLNAYFRETFPEYIKLQLCVGSTDSWGKYLNASFKMVFIDSTHDYETCKKEFDLWSPKIEPGGIIAFHDCDFVEIDQFLSELDPNKWKLDNHIYSIKAYRAQ